MQEPKPNTPGSAAVGDDRYSTFLSLSGDGIARIELDPPLVGDAPEEEQVQHLLAHSRVAECNERFARFYGKSAAEMVGHSLGDFVPGEDPARLHGIRQFIRTGYRMVHVEEEHSLGPGTSRWLSSSALGATHEGRLHDFWLCLHDVSETRRAEADRERRGRILEAVAFCAARLLETGSWRAQADQVVARLGQAALAARAWIAERQDEPDASTRIVYRSVWGAPGEELFLDDPRLQGGVSMRDAGLEPYAAEMRAGRAVVTLVSALTEVEQSFPARMGSKSFAAVPIFSNGEWWGLLVFGETRYEREWSTLEIEALRAAAAVLGAAIDRERADQALRESEERSRRLAAATFEGIALTEDGVFLDANDQLARMLGCPVADLIGQRVDGFVRPEDQELVRAHRAAGTSTYEHLARRSDGSLFPVEVRAGQTPYRGRTVRVTAVRDVSARVQAEDRQRRLEADLRQARIMEAMGSLVAGVAHEVRNPLFSISATVDALEAEIGQRTEFSEYAALLRTQVGRLSQLMRDLLDYGRPSVLSRAPTHLADVLRRAGRACATLARDKGVTVAEGVAGDVPVLEIDAARVEQAFENLLANAIQHAPSGSVVRVLAELVPGSPDPEVHCTVEDEGPGLEAEDMGRIFEPFFSRRKGGTGLGLPIVRRVVVAHGGSVTAGNREGGGACFTVVLPTRGPGEGHD